MLAVYCPLCSTCVPPRGPVLLLTASCQWRKQLLRLFGPELINKFRSWRRKINIWKHDISSAFEGDSVLSKFVVCSPPSWSRRPRLGLCQRKRFSQKRFRLRFTPKRTCTILHSAECMSTRQDLNVTSTLAGGPSVQDRYCARGFGGGAKKQRANGKE